MSNQQYDYVVELAREMNISLSVCPTCRAKLTEEAPGIWVWPESTYKLYGKEHSCDCAWQDNLRRHYLLAGIPRAYWTLSEDDYFGGPEALDEVKSYLAQWVDMKWHGIGLKLYSPTLGTGKTMLASMIGRTAVKLREKVLFVSFNDVVQTYQMSDETREPFVKRLRNSSVLILDEVTAGYSEAQRNFFATQFESLIRFRTSGNSITIITTNLTPEKLDEYYPRTFSLLADKQRVIEVKGPDRRRSGEVKLLKEELILNGEVRPIV